MKSFLKLVLLIVVCFNCSAQELSLETGLDATVKETSGLLYLNNTLITHNDSSNANALYDIDTSTGLVTRTVTINNATNTDWEDLAHDDTYIYIGDFGNNFGNRNDLKIYRILIDDYFNSTAITAELINFSYSNQTDFSPSPFATNFDAEGLLHYNNMLYVFSKNWIDGKTNVYQVPKDPGTYDVSMTDTLNAQGLVSGATYNALTDIIMLCGYDADGAFVIELSAFNAGLFSNGNIIKTSLNIPENYSQQIEGITPVNTSEYYLSAEENAANASGLYRFTLSSLTVDHHDETLVSFYPNPASKDITLSFDDSETKIYALTGQLVKTSTQKRIDISDLRPGLYWLKILKKDTQTSIVKHLMIKQ